MTHPTLRTTHFSEKAQKPAATASVLEASLFLFGADTRQGLNAEAKSALDVIKANSHGSPQRAAYVGRIEAAARATTPRAAASQFTM